MRPDAEDNQPNDAGPLHCEATSSEISYRPELPDWGAYLRWPENGNSWIHPDDIPLATELIPSRRVFLRTDWDGEFYHLQYGERLLRVRPSMWTQVPSVDLIVSQQVELLAQFGKHDPGVYKIADIFYDAEKHHVEFALMRGEIVLEKLFSRCDIRPVFVRHNLRVGYYKHQPPKQDSAPRDSLNVGKLTDE